MTNTDIKNYAKLKGVKLWRIANEIGVTDSTLSRKLRKEFTDEEKEKIYCIIDRLSVTKN